MKKASTLFTLLVPFIFSIQVFAQPVVTLTTPAIAAGIVAQNTSNHIVYVVQMSVANQAVTINNVQVNLLGTHDNNDLGAVRVYFNSTAPNLTGANSLSGLTANFAGPHLYNLSVNRSMSAGSSGYFLILVDVNNGATDGNTIKVNGATDPVVFSYSTAPTLTNNQTDAGGTQTIEAADISYTTSPIAAGIVAQSASNHIVYVVQMSVATLPVTVTNVQVNLLGTHDNNDLGAIRVYFNATAPNLSGASSLGGLTANFAGPHLYNLSVNRPMAAGSSGYFLILVDVNSGANDGNTIKVNGSTDPVVFGFSTSPNINNNQTDAGGVQTIEAADVSYTSSPVAAGPVAQNTSNHIVYAVQMNVATLPVTVTNVQVNLLGTHDNDDLLAIRVYFNATAPNLSGASSLGGLTANFAGPHLYNLSVNRPMAAGSSGYFLILVDVNSGATDGNTIKVNGATDPVVFGYSTSPNVTNNQSDVGGTQTIEAADVSYTTSPVSAGTVAQSTSNHIVYVVQMNVATLPVTVTNVQVNLLGTHDNNDLGAIRVYFNAAAPSFTGASSLGGLTANFAGPHLYNLSVNRPMAAGSSGYFLILVDVNSGANDGNTIKVNGATDPVVFGFSTSPNISNNQTDAGGTQTILASGVALTSANVPAANMALGATNHIVYAVQMNVATLAVTVTSVQVNLSGTHDNDDLLAIRVYFNATAPNLSGASSLGGLTANFAAPHLYNLSVNRPMAAGSSGYFLILVDVSATATFGNTVKVNGAISPVVFGFSTTPTVVNNQTDASGTQFIGGVLPVTLTSFSGKAVNNTVQLAWKTASETDNAYFDIEHSTDAISFVTVGRINGQGTTTQPSSYNFLHTLPKEGDNYYRLKQVDKDGKFKYTHIVQVTINSRGLFVVVVQGNPVKGLMRYSIASPENATITIRIVDLAGREVVRRTERVSNGDNNLRLDVGRLSSGVYHMHIMDTEGKNSSIKKLLVEQ